MSPGEELTDNRLNAALASAVARIHSKRVGRGPTKAQSFYRHNIIVVTMEDPLAKGEQTLVATANEGLVRAMRRELQHAMRDELLAVVEELARAKVVAFMSDYHVDPDLASEIFVLDSPVSPWRLAQADEASRPAPSCPDRTGVMGRRGVEFSLIWRLGPGLTSKTVAATVRERRSTGRLG